MGFRSPSQGHGEPGCRSRGALPERTAFPGEAGGRRGFFLRPRDRAPGSARLQPLAGRLLRADAGPSSRTGARFVRRHRPGRGGYPLGQGPRLGRCHDARPTSWWDLLLRSRARSGVGRLRRGRAADQSTWWHRGTDLRASRVRRHHDAGPRALLLLGSVPVADDPRRRLRALSGPPGGVRRDRGRLDRSGHPEAGSPSQLGRRLDRMGGDAATHASVHGLGPRLLGRQLLRRHLAVHRRSGSARGAGPAECRVRRVRHRLRQRHVRRRLPAFRVGVPRDQGTGRRAGVASRHHGRGRPEDHVRERGAGLRLRLWARWQPDADRVGFDV